MLPGSTGTSMGQVDYLFPAGELPTMGVKDIYVEVEAVLPSFPLITSRPSTSAAT